MECSILLRKRRSRRENLGKIRILIARKVRKDRKRMSNDRVYRAHL